MFSFLSGGEKRTRKESHKPAWVGPLRPPVSGTCFARKNILRVFLLRSFSFCERKRTKKKAQKPAWIGPLRASVSGACLPRKKYFAGLFFEKPRREKWVTDEGGRLPNRRETNAAGRAARWPAFIPLPDKVSFLWFFRSFPERKERTDHCAPDARKAGDGTPDGLRASPLSVKVSFLWFFRSFPERKERTERKRKRNVKAKGSCVSRRPCPRPV